ncbi:MAG: hypothetical protein BRD57_02950 [Proteobacteria bacterium SW_6_67_9]|nr:MAG: hypothetical protein BRD57_02950 [Proteobacteria bacterium SW_6_67_9]
MLAAFFIGWFYGFVWRRCLARGGLWMVIYVSMIAFSVYLIAQAPAAILFRFLEVLIPTTLAWNYLEGHDPTVRERRVALNAARRTMRPRFNR